MDIRFIHPGRLSAARVISLTCSITRRPALRWTAFGLIAFAIASQVWGECVETKIIGDTGGEPLVETSREDLYGAVAFGEDLRITVETSRPIEGSVELVDSSGEVVASESVFLDSNQSAEVVLTNALQAIPEMGFQFSMRLKAFRDGEWRVLAQLPVRFRLDCAPGDSCRIVAQESIVTNRPLVPQQLIDALDEAKELGSADLFGFVLDHYPELLGSVYELALQTPVAEREPRLSKEAPAPTCDCQWVVSHGQHWQMVDTSDPIHPARELLNNYQIAGNGEIAGQTVNGTIGKDITSAFATIGMHMICSKAAIAVTQYIPILSRPLLPFKISVIEPCNAPCQGVIRHDATASVCTEAKVFTGGGQVATADLSLTSDFIVDGTTLFSVAADVNLNSGLLFDQGLEEDSASRTMTRQKNRSVGTLLVNGSLTATAHRSNRREGSYGFAALSSHFDFTVNAAAECVAQDGFMKLIRSNGSGGGIVLERWGDPP